ncbi:murein L,D-transpeptidase catalytic domain family protein [Jannaschia aquimarina]|uniref:L,D-transpeptidase catalytic domain n=1 Tax=Jannaschia aquimarina TaxID=935700 RepID=A0A0D1CJX2_9RHOB|nr:murein L,D-transpeptidase catalytic domain family protein [Jannaschia aquimarina]KIT15047.1 hypothetical protein jaqu_33730 [Jannaschia aquimarina]SNS62745.1 L,D-transpeptidase catalytic domain [Jannaschia aquimarina]
MTFTNFRRIGLALVLALAAVPSKTAAQSSDIPGWLRSHVGLEDGQIAPIVLERARALYQEKRRAGTVRNPCYLAMDATRPSLSPSGQPSRRFYIICEDRQSFRAISSGYGNGRKLPRADFSNGRQCARNFSNAEGSKLTMGGAYRTAETRTSFKGYYRRGGVTRAFNRTFLLFDGEGETRNARERAIGGHRAMFLKWQCRLRKPDSPHADQDGYVPFGELVDYTSGRSNGCTTWSASATQEVLSLVEGNPTSLYVYPEGRDIEAVANAVRAGRQPSQVGLYWNSTCLRSIGAPKFWPKRQLQPVIDRWRQSLPAQPARVLPICR